MNFESDRSASSEIRSESFSAAVGGRGGRGPKCVCVCVSQISPQD